MILNNKELEFIESSICEKLSLVLQKPCEEDSCKECMVSVAEQIIERNKKFLKG